MSSQTPQNPQNQLDVAPHKGASAGGYIGRVYVNDPKSDHWSKEGEVITRHTTYDSRTDYKYTYSVLLDDGTQTQFNHLQLRSA